MQAYVVYTDSHFVVIMAKSERDAHDLKGEIRGHYLSTDMAHEAANEINDDQNS